MFTTIYYNKNVYLQIAFAWGVPAIISGLLVAFDSNVMSGEKHNPSFQYGNAQAAISVFMLVMCFIGKLEELDGF